MGVTERRERERTELRTKIVEAARDIVSEQGLDALSMRAIADRIEYSPATLYLHFRDKDELLREVVRAGFERMLEISLAEVDALPPDAGPGERHRALGRGYVRFALGHTAYFRVMFELPSVARVRCPADCLESSTEQLRPAWTQLRETVQSAVDAGVYRFQDAAEAAVVSWGLVHGLTALYLSGHLSASTNEEFMERVDAAMRAVAGAWSADETLPAPGPPGPHPDPARTC